MEKKKILIVDDDFDIVEAIKFNLEFEGIECITAHDGEEALFKAKNEYPDLIVLDVMLPKINGFKVCRLLKFDDVYKKIPIIMLTARAQEKDVKIGGETGADKYLTKPFEMDHLVSLVNQFI